MSRSEYSDDLDNWAMIKWRGAVAQAIRGKRGQQFLRELLIALDAMPEKRLISHDLVDEAGGCCTLGVIGKHRGVNLDELDPHDHERLSAVFGVSGALIREIENENDECAYGENIEARRWTLMRQWVLANIKVEWEKEQA